MARKTVHWIPLAIVLGCVWFLSSSVSAQDVSDNKTCLDCHAQEGMTGEIDGKEVSIQVDEAMFKESAHGGLSCTDCHDDIKEVPHEDTLKKVACATCHEDEDKTLKSSVHGKEKGPSCTVCHGEAHKIFPPDNKQSTVNLFRIQNTCGQCHSDDRILRRYNVNAPLIETLYREGVHATELVAGNEKAPSCVQCHGFHDVLPLNNVKSKTNFSNVATTCGQCHTVERDQFLESKHGLSAMSGHKDAPICTDCHGEHSIFRVSDDRSPVSFKNVSTNTCARCHASIVINEKYNIPGGKVSNYFDSYHGLALQHGSKRVANCNSCHGNHLILSSNDPRSTVSPQRLVETCGECHPGISANVLAAPIHAEVTMRSKTIVAWVPRIYIPLIVLIIGGMLLHNGVILWALLKEKFARESQQKSYTRFNRFEILCHVLLTVTFILLVITGFALVSPQSWWVTLFSYLGLTEEIRGLLHRIAAVTMIVTSIFYALYMIVTRRGRSELRSFMVWPSDIPLIFQQIAFYLGKRNDPPRFDRYDYTEKMEFWALIWGVIIMAVTGLILWFPILSFEYLPKWAIDIAELIHYYEAILATLAIVVWHFFFVIFHPEEYPMSITWLNGRMTVEHLKHRHPLEYERIKDELGEGEKKKEERD